MFKPYVCQFLLSEWLSRSRHFSVINIGSRNMCCLRCLGMVRVNNFVSPFLPQGSFLSSLPSPHIVSPMGGSRIAISQITSPGDDKETAMKATQPNRLHQDRRPPTHAVDAFISHERDGGLVRLACVHNAVRNIAFICCEPWPKEAPMTREL